MKKSLLLISIFTLLGLRISSAQNITATMKGGYCFPKLKVKGNESLKNNSDWIEMSSNYSFSLEGKVWRDLYIGTELGIASYLYDLDFKFFTSQTATNGLTLLSHESYKGHYQQEQIYFMINPQWRLGKAKELSIGLGLGINNNYINRFSSGDYSTYTSGNAAFDLKFTNLNGHEYIKPNKTVGSFINLKYNPKFSEHVGLLLESRYTINNVFDTQTERLPSIGFNSFSFLTGLSFHF